MFDQIPVTKFAYRYESFAICSGGFCLTGRLIVLPCADASHMATPNPSVTRPSPTATVGVARRDHADPGLVCTRSIARLTLDTKRSGNVTATGYNGKSVPASHARCRPRPGGIRQDHA